MMPCPNAPGCPDPDWCERCGSCNVARSIAAASYWAAGDPPPRRPPPPEPPHELRYAVDEHGALTAEYIDVSQALLGELTGQSR